MPYIRSVGGKKGEKLGQDMRVTSTGSKFVDPKIKDNPFLSRSRHGKPHPGANIAEYIHSNKSRRFIPKD